MNGYENIDRTTFFLVTKHRRTRGREVAKLNEQCRLDMRKFQFSHRTLSKRKRLSGDCVGAGSRNMFKNKTNRYCIG